MACSLWILLTFVATIGRQTKRVHPWVDKKRDLTFDLLLALAGGVAVARHFARFVYSVDSLPSSLLPMPDDGLFTILPCDEYLSSVCPTSEIMKFIGFELVKFVPS